MRPPGLQEHCSHQDPPHAEQQRDHDQKALEQGGMTDGNRPASSQETPQGGEMEANGDSGWDRYE